MPARARTAIAGCARVRGGAYRTPAQSIRSAKRDKFESDRSYDHIGIRVVREIQ